MKHKDIVVGPIDDHRLTPDLLRARSGLDQIFNTPGYKGFVTAKGDGTFVIKSPRKDDTAFVIKSPGKGIYADLINGTWHWVNGCHECNGRPRDWGFYTVCDKHDVCRKCGINRKDLTETPYGGSKGWQCKPCRDREHEEAKQKALAEFEIKGYDEHGFHNEDKPMCPYCASKITFTDMHESETNVECPVCDGIFDVEVEWTPSYSTTRSKAQA